MLTFFINMNFFCKNLLFFLNLYQFLFWAAILASHLLTQLEFRVLVLGLCSLFVVHLVGRFVEQTLVGMV